MTHGITAYSGHSPLWLDTKGINNWMQGDRPFLFEAMWVKEEECSNIIKDVFSSAPLDNSVDNILQINTRCGHHLKKWNRTSFGNVQRRLAESKEQLKNLQERGPLLNSDEQIKKSCKEVNVWLERKEIMYKQRLRAL